MSKDQIAPIGKLGTLLEPREVAIRLDTRLHEKLLEQCAPSRYTFLLAPICCPKLLIRFIHSFLPPCNVGTRIRTLGAYGHRSQSRWIRRLDLD